MVQLATVFHNFQVWEPRMTTILAPGLFHPCLHVTPPMFLKGHRSGEETRMISASLSRLWKKVEKKDWNFMKLQRETEPSRKRQVNYIILVLCQKKASPNRKPWHGPLDSRRLCPLAPPSRISVTGFCDILLFGGVPDKKKKKKLQMFWFLTSCILNKLNNTSDVDQLHMLRA